MRNNIRMAWARSMTTLYGIKNCDTVKKARRWLEANGVDYTYHDLRNDGLTPKRLEHWETTVGWETLLNRRGTTWRQLPEQVREPLTAERALHLMLEHPTLIKRPVLELDGTIQVGFKESDYETLFN